MNDNLSLSVSEGTPFAGGVFRMRLVLGKDFPASPPKGYFLTKIFHPNVGPSGEICVNVLKRDWRAELGIRHILLVRQRGAGDLLGKDFPASPPKGYFLTKIFHPNVGPSGEICVNVLKRDWRAELGIRHILLLEDGFYSMPKRDGGLRPILDRRQVQRYVS
ncbi:UNVERIFIED_CONTAM: hypothetical protein FKN15_015917 [Acipenser sinensis]